MRTGDRSEYDYTISPEQYLKLDYKTLIDRCKTPNGALGDICSKRYFWEQKTFYDFGNLYDLYDVEGNGWNAYQYYRNLFTLDLIDSLDEREPLIAEKLLEINEKKTIFNS